MSSVSELLYSAPEEGAGCSVDDDDVESDDDDDNDEGSEVDDDTLRAGACQQTARIPGLGF